MLKKIRLALESDSRAILQIYAPFIRNTVITFEYKVPSVPDFSKRITSIQEKYPWFVCEVEHHIVGYAYASQFNQRAAYDWSVDLSVYIAPDYQRHKIATALYTVLTETLKLQGYYNAYAIIASPNPKSERFHEVFGFKPAGVLHNSGYKLGNWHDIKWYELKLNEHSPSPEEPKTIQGIQNTPEYHAILLNAEKFILD